MDFSNDPIGDKVELSMSNLKKKGVEFADSSQYNRVFEAFYELHKEIEILKQSSGRIFQNF